jgi:phosphatidylglycerol:prolipoprotein diacylglycerol transferase
VRPELFRVGDFALPSYGMMLVISFLTAIFFVRRTAKKRGIDPNLVENLAFYLMLGVIIGGRLLYVIFHWQQYDQNPLDIFALWKGGMMFFGGFIGGLIASILYLRKEKISISVFADIIAPAIALGTFFTRIGCFLNGCCFGQPSSLPWAVKFPPGCAAGKYQVHQGIERLHPTQLYSSIFGFLLFFFLWHRLKQPHKDGQVFSLYLLSYGTFRFLIDFLRYYEDAANFWINQLIALGIAITGLVLFRHAEVKST